MEENFLYKLPKRINDAYSNKDFLLERSKEKNQLFEKQILNDSQFKGSIDKYFKQPGKYGIESVYTTTNEKETQFQKL